MYHLLLKYLGIIVFSYIEVQLLVYELKIINKILVFYQFIFYIINLSHTS